MSSLFNFMGIAAQSFDVNGYSLTAQTWPGPSYLSILGYLNADGANTIRLGSPSMINLTTGAISDVKVTNSTGATIDHTESFASMGPAISAAEAHGLTFSSNRASKLFTRMDPSDPCYFMGSGAAAAQKNSP